MLKILVSYIKRHYSWFILLVEWVGQSRSFVGRWTQKYLKMSGGKNFRRHGSLETSTLHAYPPHAKPGCQFMRFWQTFSSQFTKRSQCCKTLRLVSSIKKWKRIVSTFRKMWFLFSMCYSFCKLSGINTSKPLSNNPRPLFQLESHMLEPNQPITPFLIFRASTSYASPLMALSYELLRRIMSTRRHQWCVPRGRKSYFSKSTSWSWESNHGMFNNQETTGVTRVKHLCQHHLTRFISQVSDSSFWAFPVLQKRLASSWRCVELKACNGSI